jgi:hypothetical protein
MTPRTPQCEVFWAFLLNSKHSGVLEDSKSLTLEVLGFTPTLGQSGVATILMNVTNINQLWGLESKNIYNRNKIRVYMFPNVSHKSLMFVKELDVVHCDVGSTGFLMALVALIIGKQ